LGGSWSESKPHLLEKLNYAPRDPAKLTNSLTYLRKDCGWVSQLKPTVRFTYEHATLDHTKRIDFDVKCSSRLLHYLRAE
jgi:hypothetical protein